MLLEFRVRNFRSIRDEQALTLVASGDRALAATHLAPTGLRGIPHALRSVVVYGPNASGKSNLLRALDYLRAVVAESATSIQPGHSFSLTPFKLDAASARQPTDFEITFLLEGVRHQYAFSMTSERIVRESLMVYRTSKPTQLFSRQHVAGDLDRYEFSTYLSGPRKLWQESTRPNALFLSMAAQLNSEPLSPVFNWIVRNINFLPAGLPVQPDFTTALLASEAGRLAIRDFLVAADISITRVQAVARKGLHSNWILGAGGFQASQEEREVLVPLFEHTTPHGIAKFELHEESEGTQRLYGLIAPVLECLREGRVLMVDELDSSLHTLLVRRLVTLFQTPELNARGAQLIFSTHDTSLLDHTLFRRDQIWFTEKDDHQATRLYPLTDFSPRKQEAWERGYLSGRYGAVPFFGAWPMASSGGSC